MRDGMWAVLALLLFGCSAVPGPPQLGSSSYEPVAGFYASAHGALAFENFDFDDAEDDLGIDLDVDDESFGFGGALGYRIMDYLAVEAMVQWHDGLDIDVDGVGTLAEYQTWAAVASAKLYPYPEFQWFDPYLLGGIGVLWADLDDETGTGIFDEEETEAVFRLGGGFDSNLTERIFVNLEVAYWLPTDDLEDFEFFTVQAGAGFRF